MMKVVVKLDLSGYSITDLFHLYSLRVISRDETIAEMRERGMDDVVILGRIRAAG